MGFKFCGGVNPTGEYVPPEGYKITDEGKLLKLVDGGKTQEVIMQVAPLGDNPPLNQMPTQDYKLPINGPSPAGGPASAAPQGKDGLSQVPLCPTCTYIPPSFNNSAPGSGGPGNLPRTPIRIKVIKGN